MSDTFRETTRGLRLSINGLQATVVAGPGAGASAQAPRGDSLRVGRSPHNDLTVQDPSVSERHCELRSTPQGWVLHDRSTNGTRVKGVRIREIFIEGETLIDLGDSRIRLEPVVTARQADQIDRPPGILGDSAAMLRMFDRLERVATTDLAVLLLGETGTGKELVAQELHRRRASAGRPGPFVVVDCTSVPATLAESVFLGHKKGAFTGAVADRKSPFEEAEGGTVFLDEIGDLPHALQGKLLRIVQEREVQAVGSNLRTPVDVRLIAATHRDLGALVERGEFRDDLYYRLCESVIELPPLRARGDDILTLAAAFLHAADPGKRFDASAERSLATARWPGNVRQLRSIVRRAAGMNPDKRLLTATDLFDATQPGLDVHGAARSQLSGLLEEPWEVAKDGFAEIYWSHANRRFAGATAEIAAHAQVSTVAVRARKKQFEIE